jgi:protein gp37
MRCCWSIIKKSSMTKIEWTDQTWNPVTGCDKVSQGCKNCYAEVMHRRLMGMFPDKYSKPFLGNVELHEDELEKPFTWKSPRMVFVNSMSDLFHEDVPFDFIDRVYNTMLANPRHTYQILTKRPERMRLYYEKRIGGWGGPNIWLGVSCEDQKTADERIPFLLQVPVAVRFCILIGFVRFVISAMLQMFLSSSSSGASGFRLNLMHNHHLDFFRLLNI